MTYSTAIGLSVFAATALFASLPLPVQATDSIEIPIESILAPPVGYNDQDNIEIVLYGNLPNSCYKLGEHRFVQRPDGATIRVQQFAVLMTDGPCAAGTQSSTSSSVQVPFTETVALGSLVAGQYRFDFLNGVGSEQYRLLNVSRASSPSARRKRYAVTTEVSAPDLTQGDGRVKITISGILNTTCTNLENEVQVRRRHDVYVVQPLVLVPHDAYCGQVIRPFSRTLDLGPVPRPGRYLIQVKSAHGRTLNRVFDVS